MQSNAKRPVSAHHIFRAVPQQEETGGTQVGVGDKYPCCDFGRGVLTEELLLGKSKKLPDFLLQNITWLRTSNCDAG